MSRNMFKGAMVSFAVLFLTVFIAGISPAWAIPPVGTTLTVTTLNDEQNANGLCSLREAIINANNNDQSGSIDCSAGTGADTINFSVTGTITLSSQLPAINQALTIDGPGAGSLTISGAGTYRVIYTGAALNVEGLTIANGFAAAGDLGGGIYNSFSSLSVSNSTFSGNYGGYGGGGIMNDRGTATISNCTFTGNSGGNHGGGIFNYVGPLTITNSTFSGNSTVNYHGAGIYNEYGTANISNSTFSGNSAAGYGGAIDNYNEATANISNSTFSSNSAFYSGGAIENYSDATVNITNCTFSGNSAMNESGGGIFNYSSSTANISNSTFSGNSAVAGYGGGIFTHNNTSLTLQNSIVASNIGGDCYNPTALISNGYNLDTDNTCNLTQPTDLPNTNPQLGILADNGGPNDTMALGPTSPAIDRIPYGVNGCGTTITTDQRGFLRPSPAGGACDMGAYEVDQQIIDLSGSWSVLYSLSKGKNLSGILKTQNTGGSNAGSFKVAVYLSSNGITLGNLLATYTVTGLNAGASKNISFAYKSNISLSKKYLIAVIDSGNQISETNETNNRAVVKIQ